MPKFIGFVNAATQPDGDIVTSATTGGNTIPQSQLITVCESQDQYVSGSIINKSDVEAKLLFRGFGGTVMHLHSLRPYDSLKIKNIPVYQIGIVTASVAEIHVMLEKWQVASQLEMDAILADSEMEDRIDAPVRVWDQYSRASINSATTTTVITPTSGQKIRLLAATISVDAADVVSLEWTDSDGTSNAHFIGVAQFTGASTYTFGFGPDGIACPNGNDGLLRAITTTTANCKVDAIWSNSENNK